MRAFILVLIFLASAAEAIVPQVVSTKNTVCLLTAGATGQGEVHCWNFYGQPVPTPHLRGVTEITATADTSAAEETLCALASGRLRCWGSPFAYSNYSKLAGLTSIEKIAGGDQGICAFDAKENLKCVKHDAFHDLIDPRLLPTVKSAAEIALSGLIGCVLTKEGEIACWGGGTHNAIELTVIPGTEQAIKQVPTGLKLPHSLSVGRQGVGCIVDGDQVKCWGALAGMAGNAADSLTGISGAKLRETFNGNELSGLFLDRLQSGKLWTTELSQDSETKEKDLGGLGEPILFDRRCAVSLTEIYCGNYPFLHDQDLELAFLGRLVEQAKRGVYTEKRKIFATANDLLIGAKPEQRRFVFLALAPLFELTGSEYVSGYLRSQYQGYRRTMADPDLAHISLTLEIARAALELLRAALPLGETGADRDLLTAIGQALAAPGDSRARHEVSEAYRRHQNEWDAVQAIPKNQAPATLIRRLVQYLDS